MIKSLFPLLILAASLLAGCAAPHSPGRPPVILPVDNDLELSLHLPGPKWQYSRAVPDLLVERITGHLAEEAASSGLEINNRQLQQVARKRLAVNEGFVLDPASGAYLLIDFRRLSAKEKVPEKADLVGSARGAELALRSESGVSEVSGRISRIRIAGSRLAYRTDIRYQLHGEPRKFSGIIGCTQSHRFYFYFNDPLQDPSNAAEMDELIGSLAIHSGLSR